MVFRISEEELEEAMRQNELEDAKPKKSGCCGKACKTIMRLSFSHIGMCVLLTLYVTGGAFLFIAIEENLEADGNKEMMLMSEEVKNETKRVGDILKKYRAVDPNDTMLKDGNKEMMLMSEEVKNETKRVGDILKKYRAVDPNDTMLKDGKSIPQQHFEYVLRDYHLYVADAIKTRNYVGKLKEEPEGEWNFAAALLYTVSTVTAIGYGHIAPKTENGQVVTILYCIVGIPLTLMFLANIGELLALGIRWFWGKISAYKKRKGVMNEDGKIEEIETKTIQVPVIVTLLIFAIYIVLGSVVFSIWEKWTVISSVYFILASLTTIGFGDLVPGWEKTHTLNGKFKLAFSSLYIVFGLAFLSMAFSLLIEKARSAAKNASLNRKKSNAEREDQDEDKKQDEQAMEEDDFDD